MPAVLTGGKPEAKTLPPSEELAELAGKLAAGSATEADRARFREFAVAA